MIYIGCHLSVTNGYEAMGHQMVDFGGNTFAWFTRNPRGGKSKDVLPGTLVHGTAQNQSLWMMKYE